MNHLTNLTFALLVFCASYVQGVDAAELIGAIVDADSGKSLAARITIRGEDGKWYFPTSTAKEGSAVPYRVRRGKIAAMHTTLSAHPFRVELKPGRYQLSVQRGKEYLPLKTAIEMADSRKKVELKLRRWVDMSKRGWFSGDTHSHRTLSDTYNLALAEDLNVSFPLSHWVTRGRVSAVAGNRIKEPAKSATTISLDPSHLIYTRNTEYEIFEVGKKRHTLGAFLIIGHKQLLDRGAPPVAPIADLVRQDGGLTDFEKHSWPWSLMLAPIAKVDLFELSNNHVWPGGFSLGKWTLDMKPDYMQLETNSGGYTEWGWLDYGFQTYYSLLNCGFQIQPTAGTGSGVHPVPTGFGRVYVQVPGELSVKKWLSGLKAGRSFVTTGPMMFVSANGKPAGHVFHEDTESSKIKLEANVLSRRPLDRVEVIVNGDRVITQHTESKRNDSTYETSLKATVTTNGSSWVCVRAFEKHPQRLIRFAHSSPFHVVVKNRPIKPKKAELDYIIRHLERELARNQTVLDKVSIDEFRKSIEFYRRLR